MKIVFLGTAAAEGVPGLWCKCPYCEHARKVGGKEIRRRCSYYVDDDTMIDFGPDSFHQALANNIYLPDLKRIIFTHPHGDHMSASELVYRRMPNFCSEDSQGQMLDLVASKETLREFVKGIFSTNSTGFSALNIWGDLRVNPLMAEPGVWIKTGDLEVLPIPASHAATFGAMIYVLRRGGKSVLIANDTGWLVDESWAMLEGIKLDAAVIECTLVMRRPEGRKNHMGATASLEFRDHLVEMGCLTRETPVFVNHFSHNGRASHEDMEKFFNPHGVQVAYDGLSFEV